VKICVIRVKNKKKMKILAFGIAREIIGGAMIELELAENATVSDLKQWLTTQYPRLNRLNSLLIAVNMEYAQLHQTLKSSDEIALIPPVSGG
jgi:molybdopterin converting factor subunit 1